MIRCFLSESPESLPESDPATNNEIVDLKAYNIHSIY